MGMKLRGEVKARNGFRRMIAKIGDDGAGATVDRSADKLMADSQVEVPRDTQKLAGSARFISPRSSGPRRSAGVKYGHEGESDAEEHVDYAAAVHEILKASHKGQTKAKYVEDPLVKGIGRYKMFGVYACRKLVRRSFR